MTCEHEIDWNSDALVVETSSSYQKKYLEVICRKCGAIGRADESELKKVIKWIDIPDSSQPAPRG